MHCHLLKALLVQVSFKYVVRVCVHRYTIFDFLVPHKTCNENTTHFSDRLVSERVSLQSNF